MPLNHQILALPESVIVWSKRHGKNVKYENISYTIAAYLLPDILFRKRRRRKCTKLPSSEVTPSSKSLCFNLANGAKAILSSVQPSFATTACSDIIVKCPSNEWQREIQYVATVYTNWMKWQARAFWWGVTCSTVYRNQCLQSKEKFINHCVDSWLKVPFLSPRFRSQTSLRMYQTTFIYIFSKFWRLTKTIFRHVVNF